MDAKGIESLCVIPGINHSGPRMVMGRKRAVIAVKKRPENDAQMQCIGASSCCQAHVSSVHANRQCFFFSAHLSCVTRTILQISVNVYDVYV